MGFTSLFLMSVFMGASSFAVGSLPLTFPFSHHRLKMLSTYGMGLLIGAALAVIIPEGVETLYHSISISGIDAGSSALTDPGRVIAMALLAGFSLMLFVEQFSSSHHAPKTMPSPTAFEIAPPVASTNASDSHAKSFSATLALVIHSFADGIALGSSSMSDNSGLELIVFLAIMVHKAPAALGLCTTLLSYSEPRPQIKQYLFAFSAAAPLGALITYFLVWALGNAAADLNWWAAIALLFSGGTFLYVATVIQDVSGHSHMPVDEESAASEEMSVSMRSALLVGGMFTPLVLSSLVGHGH